MANTTTWTIDHDTTITLTVSLTSDMTYGWVARLHGSQRNTDTAVGRIYIDMSPSRSESGCEATLSAARDACEAAAAVIRTETLALYAAHAARQADIAHAHALVLAVWPDVEPS